MAGRVHEQYLRLRRAGGRVRRSATGRRSTTPPSAGAAPVGRLPEGVERRTTNLGPTVDEAVQHAESRMRVGVSAEQDLVRAHFDTLHYLLQRRDLMWTDVDLVAHFLEHGVADGTSPHPDFSMANYLAQRAEAPDGTHPYVDWLRRGRAAGESADPVPRPDLIAPLIGLEPAEVVDRLGARRADLNERLRTGTLGEMVARAAEIEPLVGAAWPAVTRSLLFPLTTPDVVAGMSALHRSHEAAGFRRARVVLVVNRARRAPDLGVEGHLTHALARHVDPSEIVVIHTDDSIAKPFDRHPPGVRQVDLARYLRDLPGEDEEVRQAEAEQTLVTLLRTFHADAIVNVRSRLLFRAMRTYTLALSASERLFLCLSGNEQTPMGTWDGWAPHYFYRTFDRIAGVITDNAHFRDHLDATYQVPAGDRERIHLLRSPIDPVPAPVVPVARAADARPQVFWAGSWGRQRRVEALLEIATAMPDVDFRVWVDGRAPGGPLPPNVVLEAGPSVTAGLPLEEADAWLHTARWDGVPHQLLEVGAAGVPVVGTRVGGTGEVLGDDDAWPVAETAGADAYVRALRSVLEAPEAARERAGRLRARLLAERSVDRFAEAAAGLLLGEEPAPPTDRDEPKGAAQDD
ncbi:glycosyltransferase [Nocardioides sp. YIM 152588]|uniref:glycosyltransferase n=1 Tax=Nocardioides sp. YIM 152588 TaxID=3158259 RepID=UPI0032E3D4E0